jgi:hypothetical protein
MARTGLRTLRWLSVVLATSVVWAAAASGQATNPFRITHTVDKGGGNQVTISGRVSNEARSDAVDVHVTAEALDSAGKIVASGVSYVGSVAAGSSSTFTVKVPSVRTAATYRVIVSSFRFGFAVQS